uniref:Uncharacterized protein n=1 Tax=Romanomermis culicivorax TaxID=13658 RepID=A0A915L031_ROMCU
MIDAAVRVSANAKINFDNLEMIENSASCILRTLLVGDLADCVATWRPSSFGALFHFGAQAVSYCGAHVTSLWCPSHSGTSLILAPIPILYFFLSILLGHCKATLQSDNLANLVIASYI